MLGEGRAESEVFYSDDGNFWLRWLLRVSSMHAKCLHVSLAPSFSLVNCVRDFIVTIYVCVSGSLPRAYTWRRHHGAFVFQYLILPASVLLFLGIRVTLLVWMLPELNSSLVVSPQLMRIGAPQEFLEWSSIQFHGSILIALVVFSGWDDTFPICASSAKAVLVCSTTGDLSTEVETWNLARCKRALFSWCPVWLGG